MSATVFNKNGSVRRFVKNLGWLLKHADEVKYLEVCEPFSNAQEALLVAYLTDGGFYQAGFASKEVCYNWIKRPLFHGLKLNWFGKNETVHAT